MVSRAQPLTASRAGAARDLACAAAEHRIGRGESDQISPELGPDSSHQPLGQAHGSDRTGGRCCRVHSATALSANQPAASNTRRASSTVKCP